MYRQKSYDPEKAEKRHEGFQFGTNPMRMDAKESRMVHEEEEERKRNRHAYIRGIQGRDGGAMPSDRDYENEIGAI